MTREEVTERLQNIIDRYEGEDEWQTLTDRRDYECIKMAIEALKEERPHGKWTRLDEYESVWRCSACDEVSCCKADFCPNCGADMRKGGDEK